MENGEVDGSQAEIDNKYCYNKVSQSIFLQTVKICEESMLYARTSRKILVVR